MNGPAAIRTPRGTIARGAECYRTIGPFDAQGLPAGLRVEHRLKAGAWAVLELAAGTLRLVWDDERGGAEELAASARLAIPPLVPHHVEGAGPFEVTIGFYR